MKKTRRVKTNKFALVLIVLVLVMSTVIACSTTGEKVTSRYDLDVVDATSNFYVNDFAGIFSEEQKKSLMENAVSYDAESHGIQVVITTVKSLNDAIVGYELVMEDQEGNRIEDNQADITDNPKFTVEEVACSMYKEYGIGEDDMGILIILSTGTGNGDGDIRIETGRQMQFYITDGLAGELLDKYAMDYLYEQKYAEGLISLQNAVIEEIRKQVPTDWYSQVSTDVTKVDSQINNEKTDTNIVEITNNETVKDNSEPKNSEKGIIWGFLGTIFAVIMLFLVFVRQKKKINAERQKLEESKRKEVSALKREYKEKLIEKDNLHEKNVRSLRRDYQKLEREKDKEIDGLEQRLNQADDKISTLTKELEVITDKYERLQRLHPESNFDEEVQNMIEGEYKAKAQEVDSNLENVLSTNPTKDNCEIFADAIELIDSVQSEVRKYVISDRGQIKSLYNQAIILREEFERAEQEKRDKASAQKVYNEVCRILDNNRIGNYQTYGELNLALTMFLGLSSAGKEFFPDNSVIVRLKQIHAVAQKDYRDYSAAHNAEKEVRTIIGSIYSANENDRIRLSRAKRYYNELTSSQQRHFSDELLSKLNHLINEAADDYMRQERRRREEAERRRAQQQRMNSHTHTTHSSSSFRGHGGRPSGGGASRKF